MTAASGENVPQGRTANGPGDQAIVTVAAPAWDAMQRTVAHDLRSPLSSILALIALHQCAALATDELAGRVTAYAVEGLSLLDELAGAMHHAQEKTAPEGAVCRTTRVCRVTNDQKMWRRPAATPN